jgi:hypothetical protein
LAQQRELPADLPQRPQVVLPEVRNRLMLRSQRLSQPHQLHRALGRLCQATAGPVTVERAVNVEFQQIS